MTPDALDDSYDRLRTTGPEFDGWLSNHGPMAVEALVRHGHADDVSAWLDRYSRRLESAPPYVHRIDDWRAALGDPRRLGDWLAWFDEQLRELSWIEGLNQWWPRLLPGIAAGATHGVIRVGHAVRVLREGDPTSARIAELAQGLGYWAARWQPVPKATAPAGHLDTTHAVDVLPTIPEQRGGINTRLAQLENVPGWVEAQQAVTPAQSPEAFLRDLVTTSVNRYTTYAHGNPVMLVHASTAPNAVLRVLPSLNPDVRVASAAAAWSASAAVHAAYSTRTSYPIRETDGRRPDDVFDRAVQHGDEHVIKLADTVLDVHRWTGDSQALKAIEVATELVEAE